VVYLFGMKIYIRFFKRSFVHLIKRLRMLYSAFYLVYATPVDNPLLSGKRMRSAREQGGFSEDTRLTGKKGKVFTPVLEGALAV